MNYDVPSAPEAYVHRIGRVGRAGREGVAITLAEPREHRMLKNIERVTGQKIAIEKVPTIADLRARRMQATLSTIQETILADDLEQFRVLVDTLTDDYDVMVVAMAAIKLAHEASSGIDDDDQEIPEFTPSRDRDDRGGTARGARPDRNGGSGAGGQRTSRPISEGMTRLFVGSGRAAGVRPKDLVGAIAGETSLSGKQIGAIEIADKFSLVEVPESSVDEVIMAMKRTTIKGRKANVRRERFEN